MSQRARHIYIVAGESSGDRLGADLMRDLAHIRPDVRFKGVGGEKMIAQGLSSLFDMSDLAVMGTVDVILNLPRLLRRAGEVVRDILRNAPQAVVLIDSQLFALHVARSLRAKRFKGPIILYVAPTVWAYNPGRATTYARYFDEILGLFPFEPKVMRQLKGPPTSYVGHPAVQPGSPRRDEGSGKLIALYPGSRKGEFKRHLHLFRLVAEDLAAAHSDASFALPTLKMHEAWLKEECQDWNVELTISSDPDWRAEILSRARCALCASGTATLELAMAGVPMVVAYVMDAGQARKLKSLPGFRSALPNIVLERDLVPEHLQQRPDQKPLLSDLEILLTSSEARTAQQDGFVQVRQRFLEGEGLTSAAERVASYL